MLTQNLTQTSAASAAPAKRRIEHLDIIRGVCILFVTYFHSGISLNFVQYVATICVHPFFFMAGYFHSNKRSLGEICKKKLRTMMLPYFVFGLFYYVVWLVRFGGIGRDPIHPLAALIYMPVEGFPVEPALYFLPMMFFSSMMLAVLEKFLHNEPLKLLIVLAVNWLGCMWVKYFSFRLPMSFDCAMAVLIYVYIGARGKKILAFTDGIVAKIPHKWQRIALYLLLTAGNYYLIRINPIPNILNGIWSIVPLTHFNTCLTMLLWVYLFRFVEEQRFLAPVNRALKFVGENSICFMCFGHTGLAIGRMVASMLPISNMLIFNLVFYVTSVLVLVPVVLLLSKTRLQVIFGK